MIKEIEEPLILICDDTSKNRQVLGTILMEKSYQITVAEDGTECLKMLETVKSDLILLDVMMPYLNDYQTYEKIKSNPIICHRPIVFLSAKNEAEDIVKGFELGAVDYVSKPFNLVELLQRVKTPLEIKKNRDIILHQQQSFSLLLNNIHEGIFIFDSPGQIEPGWSISVKNFLEIDPEKIRMHLIEYGKNNETELEEKEDKEIIQSIFLPGFSTKKENDHLSAFGVGLDAVKNEVQKLKGDITVESNLGKKHAFYQ